MSIATHGARFRIADGYCVAGPCRGERLSAVAVRIEAGLVWLA
jgi:nitrite reductase/ring-hydroxylating ferredoxin subunit